MRKKILFIEDEPALQETLTYLLRENGYEVIQAFDGKDGIEKAKKENPDLVLLDLVLPKNSGFDVLENLKKDEVTQNTDVIVLTNLDGVNDVERALDLGAMTYLIKTNHSPNDVLRKVNKRFEQVK